MSYTATRSLTARSALNEPEGAHCPALAPVTSLTQMGVTPRAPAADAPERIRDAIDAIRAAKHSAVASLLERERIPQLIRWTDAMIEELEELNLLEVRRVDISWRPRLALLFSCLPFEYRPSIRAHPSPTQVVDVLFDIQAHLFNLKNGRETWGQRARSVEQRPRDDAQAS